MGEPRVLKKAAMDEARRFGGFADRAAHAGRSRVRPRSRRGRSSTPRARAAWSAPRDRREARSFVPAIVISRIATALRPSAATHAFSTGRNRATAAMLWSRVAGAGVKAQSDARAAPAKPAQAASVIMRRRSKAGKASSRIEGALLAKCAARGQCGPAGMMKADERCRVGEQRIADATVRPTAAARGSSGAARARRRQRAACGTRRASRGSRR